MDDERPALTVGLAVGEGTGPELSEVFKTTLSRLADAHGVALEMRVSPRRYRTYASVGFNAVSAEDAARAAEDDAKAYEAFLLELAGDGCGAVFRTAFNAQSIYLVRERLEGVKLEALPFAEGELFLVRDEAQGFYGGVNNPAGPSPDLIARTCEFRRETTERVIDFAIQAAGEHWGGVDRIERIVMAYKFHLLDNRFARWVAEHARARKLRIELFQPDTMNRGLLRGEFEGNVLIVGANEWFDIMHADLLARHGGFDQEERFTRNVYLAARLRGLSEYQTVHGSADDIAGRGSVNPLATMRAAAAMLERHAGRAGVAARMEAAIDAVKASGRETPGRGGALATSSVARRVMDGYSALCAAR
ncbi:MAG: isocitrate dehydrogenase [Elusimicrobia bacterium]|nr:isocitrate dehydrogenase [Elusimicrobiota bacterium]